MTETLRPDAVLRNPQTQALRDAIKDWDIHYEPDGSATLHRKPTNAELGIPDFPWAKFGIGMTIDGLTLGAAALWAGGLIAAGGFAAVAGWALAILGGLSVLTIAYRVFGLGMYMIGANMLKNGK